MRRLVSSWFLASMAGAFVIASPANGQGTYSASKNYSNPPESHNAGWRNKPCRDPWVGMAQYIVFGRTTSALCDIRLYNNGRWGSYNELVHAVARTQNTLKSQQLSLRTARVDGSRQLVPVLIDLRSQQMVAAGGGNMVAAGGGNIVGHNGGALIGADGATLIGNDAGSLVRLDSASFRALPKLTFGSGYSLQGSRIVRLPGGNALVIR